MSRSKKQSTEQSNPNEVERPEDEESMQEEDPLESVEAQGADNDLMDSGELTDTSSAQSEVDPNLGHEGRASEA
jgi:hypothetical protein